MHYSDLALHHIIGIFKKNVLSLIHEYVHCAVQYVNAITMVTLEPRLQIRLWKLHEQARTIGVTYCESKDKT